ncbi:MAG: response regulator [Longimicrobiales bacterium]|nr:response regulator [Longimicrobiales bacterium]
MTELNEPQADTDGRGPGRVLLVEDDASTRRVLVLLLELRGHEVLQTGEPQEGLRMAEEETVDLIISDIQLPGMSGIDLAEAIARRDGPPPLVAITSGDADLVARAEASGHFQRVLRKPVDVNQLLDIVDRLTVDRGDGRNEG